MRVIRLDEVDSTQRYAKQLVREGDTDFAVVAETQSFGTGRHGRRWGSPKGGLWFSFVCRKPVDLPDDEVPFLTLAVGVTVMEVLREMYSCEFEIKWPNDILVNGKKVCGILCEKVGEMFICGVGINTNVSRVAILEFNSMAESLEEATGEKIENEALMQKIVERCIEAVECLKVMKKDIIYKLNSALAYKGEMRYLTYLKKEAEILFVDENGSLAVGDEGEEKHIFVGEVL